MELREYRCREKYYFIYYQFLPQNEKKLSVKGQSEINDFPEVQFHSIQGSKLTLANLQSAIDFDGLRVRKISPSKRWRGRTIHVSQTKGKNLLVVSQVCKWKNILLAKLCKRTKTLKGLCHGSQVHFV